MVAGRANGDVFQPADAVVNRLFARGDIELGEGLFGKCVVEPYDHGCTPIHVR